jgi:hypothetical protein
MWTFSPLTATTLTIPARSTATVQYIVTNQTHKTRTLAIKPISAIQQITSGGGVCANPFVLGYLQSCILTLEIDGSLLPESIVGGPVICQVTSRNIPNPNQCYQPKANDQLNITRTPAAYSATISVNTSSLALSVKCPTFSTPGCTYSNAALSGTARIITVTNTSSTTTAENVAYFASSLPSGTTITPSSCNISPGSTCVFTVTPGPIPSASPGDVNPVPITLNIAGSNTNTLTTDVSILTYDSVYQAGYVFSVDDTTLNTTSISGKVAALSDQSTSIEWQPGCLINGSGCIPTTANNDFNGVSNTAAITSALTPTYPETDYAGGLCDLLSIDSYNDWYLPAICEMGYGGAPADPCGDQITPAIQNMQSNLADNGIGNLFSSYWSSTQTVTVDPLIYATYNDFTVQGVQPGDIKSTIFSFVALGFFNEHRMV